MHNYLSVSVPLRLIDTVASMITDSSPTVQVLGLFQASSDRVCKSVEEAGRSIGRCPVQDVSPGPFLILAG